MVGNRYIVFTVPRTLVMLKCVCLPKNAVIYYKFSSCVLRRVKNGTVSGAYVPYGITLIKTIFRRYSATTFTATMEYFSFMGEELIGHIWSSPTIPFSSQVPPSIKCIALWIFLSSNSNVRGVGRSYLSHTFLTRGIFSSSSSTSLGFMIQHFCTNVK